MEYLRYTKIIVLPYNSIDVKSRDEIKEFKITLDDELKEELGIEEVSFLKKDQFLNDLSSKINKFKISDPILYVSQNSLSETLKNFKEERVCLILIPGEYNIENENIITEKIKIIAFSENNDNHAKINILSNVLFNCKYFNIESVKFTINKNKESYFDRKYSTYSGLIFTNKLTFLSFSGCEFTNDIESKDVKIFNILEGAEKVNINECKFNTSNYEIQKSTTMISNNIFNSTDSNIRFSNSIFHRNNFSGNFRMDFFNSFLSHINNNVFIDIEGYYGIIRVDHNTNLYLTNNKIMITNKNLGTESCDSLSDSKVLLVLPQNFSLVNVNRHSKCYIDNNNIEIKSDQILSTVEFGGELYVSNNTFNRNDIEIAGYDCKVFIEKNNKLIDNDETIKFFMSERNIIKPSNKYISFC